MQSATQLRSLRRKSLADHLAHRRPCVAFRAAAVKQPAKQPVPPDVMQVEQSHGMWDKGVHFVAMEVRDYELDQFQVVNNAVYASYVQHGRHKAFNCLGMDVGEFQQQGTLMALSELSLQYKAPLRSGDVFYVTTAVAQMTAARLLLDHTVQQVTGHLGSGDQPQVVCQGQATVVFLDEQYKPVRVPAQVKDKLIIVNKQYQER